MMLTADEAVANGVEVLDEKLPDWRRHVDLATIDLPSVEGCLLAQVAWGTGTARPGTSSGWGAGMRFLFGTIDARVGVKHGFDRVGGSSYDYDDLLKAWTRALA